MINYKEIYETSFRNVNYNLHEDAEPRYQFALNFIKKNNFKNIIDVGSGRGNFIKLIKNYNNNINLVSTDLINFHNIEVPFYEIDLCEKKSFEFFQKKEFQLLTCLDVLEHLEIDCLENVFEKFSDVSEYCVFTIANHSDIHNGVELHLTQENLDFWQKKINKNFEILDTKIEYGGRLYLLIVKSLKHD